MKRRDKYFFGISFISFICMCFCLFFYTIPNETKNFNGISLSEYVNYCYLNNHPSFNYLNGLWLSFAGIGTIFLLEVIGLPNIFEEIDKKIMKLKNKRKKD